MGPEVNRRLDEATVDKLTDLLIDEESRRLLKQVTKFRRTMNPEFYPEPNLETEYYPEGAPVFNNIDVSRLDDAGTYIGDTLADSAY